MKHTNPPKPTTSFAVKGMLGIVVVFLLVAVPRVTTLAGFPSTDEGYYGFYAMRMAASLRDSHSLPADGFLMLYPLLTSWAFEIPLNPTLLLRAVDLFVSCAAALLLYVVLVRESGSAVAAALISAIFLYAMNNFGFVQHGYKNSIFAAYVPLFLALILSQSSKPVTVSHFALIGSLVAVGVLVREPFAPFGLVAVIATLIKYGRRQTAALVLGALITSLLIVSALAWLRGGLWGIVDSYREAGTMFQSVEGQRWEMFFKSLTGASKVSVWALCLVGAASLLILMKGGERPSPVYGRALFWLAIALLPLLEPASKIGFPYHFAAALPGLAGFCAHAWRVGLPHRQRAYAAVCLAALLCASSGPDTLRWMKAAPSALGSALSVLQSGWTLEQHHASNYLLAADLIGQQQDRPGTLATSGFMFALYPLTGKLPVNGSLRDLTLAFIELNLDGDALRRELIKSPPDTIMTTTRKEWPGAAEVQRAVEQTGLYRPSGTVTVDETRSYGTFGGTVYQRVEAGGAPLD